MLSAVARDSRGAARLLPPRHSGDGGESTSAPRRLSWTRIPTLRAQMLERRSRAAQIRQTMPAPSMAQPRSRSRRLSAERSIHTRSPYRGLFPSPPLFDRMPTYRTQGKRSLNFLSAFVLARRCRNWLIARMKRLNGFSGSHTSGGTCTKQFNGLTARYFSSELKRGGPEMRTQ